MWTYTGSTGMSVWKVKCPRCFRKWDYKNKRLQVAPKYRYCKDCDKVRTDTGKALGWGRITSSE